MMINDDDSNFGNPYKTIELEPVGTYIRYSFSRRAINDLGDRIKLDILEKGIDEIVLQLRSYIWSNKRDDIIIKYPSNWKEAFKERWFPEWFLKNHPIKYTKHHIKIYDGYPTIKNVSGSHLSVRLVVINE